MEKKLQKKIIVLVLVLLGITYAIPGVMGQTAYTNMQVYANYAVFTFVGAFSVFFVNYVFDKKLW